MKWFLTILLFSLIGFQAQASSLGSVHYSGQLMDASGNPLTGTVDLRFRLYQNTTQVCQQTINTVALNNGVFNVDISFPNSGSPEWCNNASNTLEEAILTALRASDTLSIEVIDASNGVTYPRQELTPVFFSAISHYLDQKGATNGQYLKWNSTTSSWEPGIVFNDTGCVDRDVMYYNGTFYDCDTIAGTFFGADSVSTFTLDDKSVTNPKLQVGIIGTGKIADDTITGDKFAVGIFDISTVTTASGQDFITTSMISDNSIPNVKVANNAISSAKIKEESLQSANFANDAVDNSLISGVLYNNQITDNTIQTAKINNGAVVNRTFAPLTILNEDFLNNTLTTAKFIDASVTAAKINDGSVTGAKILDGNITTAKIVDQGISSASIATNAITTAKIANSAVITSKIANQSITDVKLKGIAANCGKGDIITTVNADGSFSCETNFVPGMVRPFQGVAANIPTGWQVCDGTNGTPDLRNQYIYAANNDGELLTTGGSLTHVHNITWGNTHFHDFSDTHTHNHAVSITGGSHTHSMPNHTHSYAAGTGNTGGAVAGGGGTGFSSTDFGNGAAAYNHTHVYAYSSGNTDNPDNTTTAASTITLDGNTGDTLLDTDEPTDDQTINTNRDTDASSSEPEYIKFYFICYPD